jgi:hypothetical protein
MVVHDDTANDYDEHSCQDDQARKDEKHEPAYRKPVGAVEGLVNVDEDQGEQGCIHDEAQNVALFVQVGWDFWFISVHGRLVVQPAKVAHFSRITNQRPFFDTSFTP